jgi:hypothetical protein
MPTELLDPFQDKELAALLDVPFQFRRRPVPLPADERLAYRLAVLLLLLRDCSRSNKSTLKRLHFLDWAAGGIDRVELVKGMKNLHELGRAIIRYDPLVDAALRFAAAEKLVRIENSRITLTEHGLAFLKAIDSDADLLGAEKGAMRTLGKHILEGWF